MPDGFTLLVADAAALSVYQQPYQSAFNDWLAAQPQEVMPVVIPESVTPRQIRKALNAAGLRATVEAAIAGADQDTKDAWEFSNEVRRDYPLLNSLAAAIGVTDADLDNLFLLAASY